MPVATPHMHYFTLEQRETLQRQLERRDAELREEIGADRLADLNAEPDAAALERDRAELHDVGIALGRLHTPGFGLCEDCGAEIPYSRLHAQPSAARCIGCQSKRERS